MDLQRKIAGPLYAAVSSGKISFHSALKMFRPVAKLSAGKSSPAGRFIKGHNIGHILEATGPDALAAWTSVLFPAEILYPFGITPLTLEVIVGTFSTLGLSGEIIDAADAMEVPKTMCSFHRALLGLSRGSVLQKPLFIGATSIMCDGNVKSFGEAARSNGLPFLFIDIPFEEGREAIEYVKGQLESAIGLLSEYSNVKFRAEMLMEIALNVNRAVLLSRKFYELKIKTGKNVLKSHEQANLAFPMHYLLGGKRLTKILSHCVDSIEGGRGAILCGKKALRVMWLHIVPQYKSGIWDVIDDGERARVVCDEYSNPYFGEYDLSDPLRSIAARLVGHPSNGPLERRVEHILKVARDFRVGAVVHYSSWGCHQAAGNIELLGRAVRDAGLLFLNLNGDAADSRNLGFEQHRTRLEALIENR